MKESRYGLVILAAGALTLAGSSGFVRYAFPLLLPDMRVGLGASYAQMGLLAMGNGIGYVISSILGGIFATRYGARRVIGISMFFAGITTAATGLSPTVEFALAMQLLAGLSAGGGVIPAVGLAATWFDPSKRGIASGIIVAGMPLGILSSSRFLPPVLTGFGEGGWRYGWMVMGAIVVVLGLLAFVLVRDRPRETGPNGAAEGQTPAAPTPLDWGLAYKNRAIWHLCCINFSIGFAGGIFATFFVAFLVAQRGLTAHQAGDAWGLVGLAGAISGLVLGHVSDLLGRKTGLAMGYYALFLGLAILVFLPLPGVYYASAVMGALALYGGMAVTVALTGDLVGTRMLAAAFGVVSLAFNFGQTLSPTLAGAITDLTGSFTIALTIGMVVAATAGSLCLLLPARSREEAL